MKKVIRDGMVAVVHTKRHGAGWSTWNQDRDEEMVFHPEIVKAIQDGLDSDAMSRLASKLFPDCYTGAADSLCITWIPVGTNFVIHEYDGLEGLQIQENVNWMVA